MSTYEVTYEIKPVPALPGLSKLVSLNTENTIRIGTEAQLRDYVKRFNLRLVSEEVAQ